MTDAEADEMFQENMDNYIDEVVLPEIPAPYDMYFDYEKFIRDVKLEQGRGPTLAAGDGEEVELISGGDYFFMYVQN